MAYVAITNSLVEDVKNSIDKLMQAELQTIATRFSELRSNLETHEQIVARALDTLWDPIKDLRERLAPYARQDALTIKLMHTNEVGAQVKCLQWERLYQGVPPIYTTLNANSRWTAKAIKVKVNGDDIPEVAEFLQFQAQDAEITARWKAVKEQVVTFVRSCKSLNEGVKLWPDVVRYIPESYIKRMDKKTEKVTEASKALEALRKMDFDTITASTVLARMSGAGRE